MGEQTDKKTNHWDGNTSSSIIIIIIIITKTYRKKLDFWGSYNHHWRDQEHYYYKDMKLSSGTSTLDVGFMTNS